VSNLKTQECKKSACKYHITFSFHVLEYHYHYCLYLLFFPTLCDNYRLLVPTTTPLHVWADRKVMYINTTNESNRKWQPVVVR
jgi:hypothetical protein